MIQPPCGAVHPTTGRTCGETPEYCARWGHEYVILDEIGRKQRVWWKESGEMSGTEPNIYRPIPSCPERVLTAREIASGQRDEELDIAHRGCFRNALAWEKLGPRERVDLPAVLARFVALVAKNPALMPVALGHVPAPEPTWSPTTTGVQLGLFASGAP